MTLVAPSAASHDLPARIGSRAGRLGSAQARSTDDAAVALEELERTSPVTRSAPVATSASMRLARRRDTNGRCRSRSAYSPPSSDDEPLEIARRARAAAARVRRVQHHGGRRFVDPRDLMPPSTVLDACPCGRRRARRRSSPGSSISSTSDIATPLIVTGTPRSNSISTYAGTIGRSAGDLRQRVESSAASARIVEQRRLRSRGPRDSTSVEYVGRAATGTGMPRSRA